MFVMPEMTYGLDAKHLRSNAGHLDGMQDRQVVATTDIRTKTDLEER